MKSNSKSASSKSASSKSTKKTPSKSARNGASAKRAAPVAAKSAQITLDRVPATPPGAAPTPPKDFVPPEGRVPRSPVTMAQKSVALDVARELTSSETYEEDFSSLAPPAEELGARLTSAAAWAREAKAAKAWYIYTQTQANNLWDGSLASMRKLKPEFDVATRRNPTIAERYPRAQFFLDTWKVVAERGAATRAARKKAGKAADAAKSEGAGATKAEAGGGTADPETRGGA